MNGLRRSGAASGPSDKFVARPHPIIPHDTFDHDYGALPENVRRKLRKGFVPNGNYRVSNTPPSGRRRMRNGLTLWLDADRGVAALLRVTASRLCAGCGPPFEPRRPNQVKCRPACRVRALRRHPGRPDQRITTPLVTGTLSPSVTTEARRTAQCRGTPADQTGVEP